MDLKPASRKKHIISLSLELIPIVLFFVGSLWNIYVGTALLMVGSTISIFIYYYINGKLPILTIALGVLALIFGALTLIFHQEYIIKIKVTVLNLIIATVFFVAAMWRKNIVSIFTPKFARKPSLFVLINYSWGVFFIFMGILNEIVWRNSTTQVWVYFKVFGIPSMVIMFGLLQAVLILIYIQYRKGRMQMKKFAHLEETYKLQSHHYHHNTHHHNSHHHNHGDHSHHKSSRPSHHPHSSHHQAAGHQSSSTKDVKPGSKAH